MINDVTLATVHTRISNEIKKELSAFDIKSVSFFVCLNSFKQININNEIKKDSIKLHYYCAI